MSLSTQSRSTLNTSYASGDGAAPKKSACKMSHVKLQKKFNPVRPKPGRRVVVRSGKNDRQDRYDRRRIAELLDEISGYETDIEDLYEEEAIFPEIYDKAHAHVIEEENKKEANTGEEGEKESESEEEEDDCNFGLRMCMSF